MRCVLFLGVFLDLFKQLLPLQPLLSFLRLFELLLVSIDHFSIEALGASAFGERLGAVVSRGVDAFFLGQANGLFVVFLGEGDLFLLLLFEGLWRLGLGWY